MVFNLRNNKDLLLVVLLLLLFNLLEYWMPSKVITKSAFITGALTFVSLVEIFQYLLKRYGYIIFFILVFLLLAVFEFNSGYFGKPYMYGVYSGVILSVILKLFNKRK